MICKNCGCEEFEVVWIKRNRRWSVEKDGWVFDGNVDTRKLLCEDCGNLYYIPASIAAGFVLLIDKETMKLRPSPVESFSPMLLKKSENQMEIF
jgi:hypothetical protein